MSTSQKDITRFQATKVEANKKEALQATLEEKNRALAKVYHLENEIIARIWGGSDLAKTLSDDYLSNELIDTLVANMAEKIMDEYKDCNPVLVPLLDGALPFANKLFEKLDKAKFDYQYSTMNPSSYGDGLQAGELKMGSLPKIKLTGRHVILVDDLCESGNTLVKIAALFNKEGPISISSMVLLDKKVLDRKFKPTYSATEVDPKDFLIGFGMDFRQGLRLEPEVKAVTNLKLLESKQENMELNKKTQLIKDIKALIKEIKSIKNPAEAFFNSSFSLHSPTSSNVHKPKIEEQKSNTGIVLNL